jgi:hypothetical protein
MNRSQIEPWAEISERCHFQLGRTASSKPCQVRQKNQLSLAINDELLFVRPSPPTEQGRWCLSQTAETGARAIAQGCSGLWRRAVVPSFSMSKTIDQSRMGLLKANKKPHYRAT